MFEPSIKSATRALRNALGNADVDEEELHTAICSTERLLNSRPITYVSVDVNDLTPLTPSHFLCQLGGGFALNVVDNEATKARKR